MANNENRMEESLGPRTHEIEARKNGGDRRLYDIVGHLQTAIIVLVFSAMSASYIDLQLNGYRGIDFNSDELSAAALHEACELLRTDGVAGVLATVITDGLDRMTARLAKIAAIRGDDPLVRELIWGVHIEGPFLNETPGYVGAHPPEHVQPASVEAMKRLLDAADGLTRIVTLAPERDAGMQVTRFLAEQGVIVSAGHCDASLDQLRAAVDAGLSMFTHLGNGCPMLMHRHDNIVQRVLSVADGVHIAYPALGNYLRCVGPERAIVVTDGTAAAGLGPGRYTIGSQEILIGEERAAWARDRSHLIGATATMPQVAEKLERKLGLSRDAVLQLTSINPRRALGILATDGTRMEHG
jgi:N-acetylglucosamine-6-phosphate deacetylase